MTQRDLGEELEKLEQGVEQLKHKQFTLLGLSMTPTTIGALLALVGSVIGMLYGGFLTYQKVEEIASLDLGAIQSQLEQTAASVHQIKADAETIKTDLKEDIRAVKNSIEYVETKVDSRIQAFDTKLLNLENKVDDKITRFETTLDKTKTDLEDRLQKALDNPLAN